MPTLVYAPSISPAAPHYRCSQLRLRQIANAVNAVTRAGAWTDGRQVSTACVVGGCYAWALEGLRETRIPPVSSGDVALATSTKHIAYNIAFKLYSVIKSR